MIFTSPVNDMTDGFGRSQGYLSYMLTNVAVTPLHGPASFCVLSIARSPDCTRDTRSSLHKAFVKMREFIEDTLFGRILLLLISS